MASDTLEGITLLTSGETVTYESDIADVQFRLSADPFADPELALRTVDPAGEVITVDWFNTEFLSDVLSRTRATRRIARTIERELDVDAVPEDIDEVFDAIWSDLASTRVVVVDDPTKAAIENVTGVTYTPGKERPWTVVSGQERYDRRARSFTRSLVQLGPRNMGTGGEPPNSPPSHDLANETDRWQAFARVVEEIATVGEQPARRESLDVTDPEHIDRLPSAILCGVSHGELTEIITEADRRTGDPDSVEGQLRERSKYGRPSKSVLDMFISENGLADELADASPPPA